MDILAKDYLNRAKARVTDAGSAKARGDFPDAVRYSQECVEMCLKASLRVLGVEYPKVHDVGDLIVQYRERFPKWFASETPKLREISATLALKRGPSVYGLETSQKTPSQLFGEKDAEEAMKDARFVFTLCSKFFKEFYGKRAG